MRPVLIVVYSPLFYDTALLLKAQEPVLVKAFISELPVEALYIGVLNRLARINVKCSFTPLLCAQASMTLEVYSGPLSTTTARVMTSYQYPLYIDVVSGRKDDRRE